MNLNQFINSLSKEDLAKINKKFNQLHNKIPSYAFSKITLKQLRKLVKIKEKTNINKFDKWFNYKITIDEDDLLFLQQLLRRNHYFLRNYQEDELKIKFIGRILNHIDFNDRDKEICDFYNRKLKYKNDKFILNGHTDFMVAKGDFYPEMPYFFIQEYKPSKGGKDPEPQLYAELIAALELNQFNAIKGAFIMGNIWNFVILEKLGTYQYQYFVSKVFDSGDLEDLQQIYKNLLYVKQEIFNYVT